MRTFLAILGGTLLLPVLVLHNRLHKSEAMSPAYLKMHPTFQLQLLKRNAWWLILLTTMILFLAAPFFPIQTL